MGSLDPDPDSLLWIRIRIVSRFNGVPGYVSGFAIRIRIQEGKNDPQTSKLIKKLINLVFRRAGCSLLI
jgi:hypothetical protein